MKKLSFRRHKCAAQARSFSYFCFDYKLNNVDILSGGFIATVSLRWIRTRFTGKEKLIVYACEVLRKCERPEPCIHVTYGSEPQSFQLWNKEVVLGISNILQLEDSKSFALGADLSPMMSFPCNPALCFLL